ncbi:MAG: DNA polymerase III subunit delta' [Ignavibacterium sp.]
MSENNFIWSGIIGQQKIKNVLTKILLEENIPQALLFIGDNGIGKDFIAIRFANLLNYPKKSFDSSTTNFIKLNSINNNYIKFIFYLPRGKNEESEDGPLDKLSNSDYNLVISEIEEKKINPYYKIEIPTANDIKINSIREINNFLSLSFNSDQYRIVIISDAHLMNEEAQNALLKNLEEPPEKVVFILTTNQPEKLRQTIVSRCWHLNFDSLSEDELTLILKNYFKIDEEKSKLVLPFANGSYQTALQLIENDLSYLKEKTIEILRYGFGGKFYTTLENLSEFISKKNQNKFIILLNLIIYWFSDFQNYRINNEIKYFQEYPETFQKFSKNFPDLDFSQTIKNLESYIYLILNNNINLNIIVNNVIFEIASLTNSNIK